MAYVAKAFRAITNNQAFMHDLNGYKIEFILRNLGWKINAAP